MTLDTATVTMTLSIQTHGGALPVIKARVEVAEVLDALQQVLGWRPGVLVDEYGEDLCESGEITELWRVADVP